MHHYPKVDVKRQSFANVKRATVPNQSMSLREIIKRFVRREALPVSKEGLYEERFGDIEKMSRLDITEQMEVVNDLKTRIAKFEAGIEAQNKKEREEAKKRYDEEVARKAEEITSKEPQPEKGKAAQKSSPKGGT